MRERPRKDGLNAPMWATPATIIVPGTAIFVDTTGPAAKRFYRVLIP